MKPSGIEPATFRFVAQYLNHCATAVPQIFGLTSNGSYGGERQSVFCVDQRHSDRDRAKAELPSVSSSEVLGSSSVRAEPEEVNVQEHTYL